MGFLPQYRLLWKIKDSRSISTGLYWISLGLQVVLFTDSILHGNREMIFAFSTSILAIVYLLILVYYYRPRGRH
jgi:hypothetical protein